MRISVNETACTITGDVKPEGEWRTIVFMGSAGGDQCEVQLAASSHLARTLGILRATAKWAGCDVDDAVRDRPSSQVVGRIHGALAADVPRIEGGDRLQQENVGLVARHGLVLHPLGNDEELSLVERDDAIPQMDG